MKLQLFLFFSILSISISQSQIGFEEHNIYNNDDVIYFFNNAEYFDIEGDGDLDVFIQTGDKIGWYENLDGLGNFSRLKLIAEETEVGGFILDDLDGDGDVDIAMTFSENGIQWIENLDGQGTFGTFQTIDPIDFASVITSADFDGDGDIDLAAISLTGLNSDLIAWYENTDGQGTFGPPNPLTYSLTSIDKISEADFDGDGDLDIFVFAMGSDSLFWFENLDGQGNFGNFQTIAVSNDINNISAVDLDNDGDLDVVGTLYSENDIVWYKNLNGNGNFSNKIVLVNNLDAITSVIAVDFDSDGDNDLVVENDLAIISWYENLDGNASFGTQQIISNESTEYGQNFDNFDFGDINNDGHKDLLWTSSENIFYYKSINGTGNVEEPQYVSRYLVSPQKVLADDLNGDGFKDFLSHTGSKIVWYANLDGAGNFGYENLVDQDLQTLQNVYIEDIDGDNDLDIIAASRYLIAYYENTDGQGNFGTPITISTLVNYAKGVTANDLDGDGDMDVVSVSTLDDKVAWYENLNGQGMFGPQNIISTQEDDPIVPLTIDVDNDGDKDLIIADDTRISMFVNTDGQGNFGARQIITSSVSSTNAMFSEDLDNDGDLDLVFNSYETTFFFENSDGLGNFIFNVSLFEYKNLLGLTDVDGDNDIDILIGKENNVIWFENLDGQGTFQENAPNIIITDIAGTSSLFSSDLNGDGNKDIISSVVSYNKVSWYDNLGLLGNRIDGNIRIDLDANGCDQTDIPMQNLMVTTTNGTNTFATFTQPNGYYFINTNEGDFTTSIASVLPTYYTSTPSSHTSSFIGLGNFDTADFCVTPDGTVNDLNIVIYPLSVARPGFDAEYEIVFRNVGNTFLDGDLNLVYDETKINFLNASEPHSAQTSNSVTFNYFNLSPFETRAVTMYFHVAEPPTTDIGDMLSFTAAINPVTGDFTEEDNTFTFEQIVVGSFDPNDIQVLEGESIFIDETDDYLHYIIRFQNTGTASAINVTVTNELDPNLDWNTLQIENISHANRVEITDGNQVEFIFNNINLPAATTNEPDSHGYIQYKIKPKSTVELGDFMNNSAAIYFDFNPPIITNTVTTTVIDHLGLEENDSNYIALYPIPSKDILNIRSTSTIIEAIVYNELGQHLLNVENNKGINSLNVAILSNGIYFIRVKDFDQNIFIKKFIKQE